MEKLIKITLTVLILGCFLFQYGYSNERKNLSIDDVIQGFKKHELFYFEMSSIDEKYHKTFNKCLDTLPADAEFMKKSWAKVPSLKNAFEAKIDNVTISYFIYESNSLCEEIRGQMKTKMDAYK